MTKKLFIILAVIAFLVVDAATAIGQETNFTLEQNGIHAEVGAGLALILPVVHTELRYHVLPPVSLSAFASAGYLTIEGSFGGTPFNAGVLMANTGVETRAHLYFGRFWDLHGGAGVSVLALISDTTAWIPVTYLNAGVTFAPAPRLRFDADINPMFSFDEGQDAGFVPLPVVRARWVF